MITNKLTYWDGQEVQEGDIVSCEDGERRNQILFVLPLWVGPVDTDFIAQAAVQMDCNPNTWYAWDLDYLNTPDVFLISRGIVSESLKKTNGFYKMENGRNCYQSFVELKQEYLNAIMCKEEQIDIVHEIETLDQSINIDTGDVIVYIVIKENHLCNVVLIALDVAIPTDSIVVSYCKDLKLKSVAPFHAVEGDIVFIDDFQDERVNSFKVNYTPFSTIVESFINDFMKINHLDSDWNIAEIGYTTVNDKKNPWRWAVTFINKTNKKLEKQSFLFEKGKWLLQKTPAIKYYFASYLTNFET